MGEVSTLKTEAQILNSCDPVTRLHLHLNSANACWDAVQLKLCNAEEQIRSMWHSLIEGSYVHYVSRCEVLNALSEIGRSLGEAKLIKDKHNEELGKCHAQLKFLDVDMNVKNNEIERLQANLQALEVIVGKLEQRVQKMQQQIFKERAGLGGSYVDGLQSPFLLESVSKDMFLAVSSFSSLYAKYTTFDGRFPGKSFLETQIPRWKNIDAYTTRDQHWILLLKSIICTILFRNFESEAFIHVTTLHNTALFLDPEERVRVCFKYFEGLRNDCQETRVCTTRNDKLDLLFIQYLASASSTIFSGSQETTWLAHLRLMNISSCSSVRADESNLVESFIRAAKKVWDFHKLCLSFEPPATIFRVADGEPFNELYMDSPVALDDDHRFVPKVGFMIYPGFRLRKTIIKSQVYFQINA